MRRTNFRITVEGGGPVYWPFWPFKVKKVAFSVHSDGFKVTVDQAHDVGQLTGEPITVAGHVKSDGSELTTVVDFRGGSRLKRVTNIS